MTFILAGFQFKKLCGGNLFFWLLALILPFGILIANSTGNSIKTTFKQTNPYHGTRVYNLLVDTHIFCKQLESIIPRLTTYGLRWKLVSSECYPTGENPYIVNIEVPVLLFIDDLEIRMHPSADNRKIHVEVYSKSRIGKYDFGENKRHVYTLFNALDKNLDNK